MLVQVVEQESSPECYASVTISIQMHQLRNLEKCGEENSGILRGVATVSIFDYGWVFIFAALVLIFCRYGFLFLKNAFPFLTCRVGFPFVQRTLQIEFRRPGAHLVTTVGAPSDDWRCT